jgi:polynucleotide 5'-hydroxyl-kinase GRC3/NOL9
LCSESTPEDWLRTIEECASKPSTILITGSHSSGKNCFARRLLNRYLTGIGKAAKPVPSICFLDLDPESPEYTPHGQISLAMIRELTLGPSFTRPANLSKQEESPRNETIRAHAIPSNLANYQEYYQACIDDLFLTYKNLYSRDSSLPLLINTPGFLYTTNFNILEQLLARSKPHRIVHLGDTRNVDADTAAKLHVLKTISTQQRSTVHEITAQVPLLAPLRSKADLKAMHMQSYFHFTGTPQAPTWSTKTLSHLAPWEFSYQETKERTQDLVGFLSYAEPIKPSSLIHSLNGSLVQIIQTSSARIPTPYTALPRTAKLQIPYFAESTTTGMVDALDPRTSKLVCTALIRGFDPERRVVQVLVPKVCEDLLRELVPERTVFVAGCCEAPEWAYMEDAYAAQNAAEGARAGADSGELPLWVEKESVMDDMGYLNTLRRVRKFQT